jgi:hypothetical protein
MEYLQNCPNCGQPRQPGDRFCSNCGRPFEEPVRDAEPAQAPSPKPQPPENVAPQQSKYVAWEDRQNLGFFEALWQTWKESVIYPNRFFSRVPVSGGLAAPLLYALIITWLSYVFDHLYSWIFSGFWQGILGRYLGSEEAMFKYGIYGGSDLVSLLIAPFVIIVLIFVVSGIYHLLALIFGWAQHGFEATFRAVSYSAGPFMFAAVPMCGSLIGVVWAVVLTIIGVKHTQETTGGKATVVVLLPWFLCCCIISLLAIIFSAAMFGIVRELMQSGYHNY